MTQQVYMGPLDPPAKPAPCWFFIAGHLLPGHIIMMKTSVLAALMGLCLVAAPASAQQRLIHGNVTNEIGDPLSNVQVTITGTARGTTTTSSGAYVIPARTGETIEFRYIGTQPIQRTVGTSDTINVQLKRLALNLNAVTVTAPPVAIAYRRALSRLEQGAA